MIGKILDIESIEKAKVINEPFPYFIIDTIIRPEVLADVVKGFPQINKRGSFPLNAVTLSGQFATLIQELQHEKLRNLIGEKFDMDLKDKPPMVTLRGHTGEKDGQIHVDSASKLITVLLYLNLNWQADGGRLRLLYNKQDLEPFAAEIAPEAGRCLIFKVTKNCWHGHAPFVGQRHSIQLNYVTSDEARDRNVNRHRFSAFLKKLFSKRSQNDQKNPVY
jgi:SM-20-related protein